MKPLSGTRLAVLVPRASLRRLCDVSLRLLADSWDLIYILGLLAYAVTMMLGILDQSARPPPSPVSWSYNSSPM
jgi:hypothetical protein